MKRVYTLLLAVSFALNGMGQTTGQHVDSALSAYRPFVIEGAHWAIDESICDEMGSCDAGMGTYITDVIHHFYKLEGDTVFNSITYKKMYHNFWYTGYPIWGTSYQEPGIYGYFRDDTLARKVYWIPVGSPLCYTDSIFLDFSHQVGDTFNMPFTYSSDGVSCSQDSFTIDSMDFSGFEGYLVRTKYFYNYHVNWGVFGNLGNLRLFEGIGFSYGFQVDYGGGDGNSQGSWLISYCVGLDSECPSAINNILPEQIHIALIPNPANDIVKIKATGALITEVEIIDMNGRRVLTTPQSEVDVSNLAPAIYFAIIHTNLGIARRKLVKD